MSDRGAWRLAVSLVLAFALHAAVFWLGGWQERFEKRTDRTIAVRLGPGDVARQMPPSQHESVGAMQHDGGEKDPRQGKNAQVVHSRVTPKPAPSSGTAEQVPRAPGLAAETLDSGTSEARRPAGEDYRQVLAGWLSQHREYPLHLRRLGVTGEGVLHLKVERTGVLVLARMEEGTGDRRLDELTLTLARRADPFPAMPEDLAGSTFDCLIDVRYELPP